MGILDEGIKARLAEQELLADRSLPDSAATKLSTLLYNNYLEYATRFADGTPPFDLGPVANLGQGAEKERPSEILDSLDPRTIDGSSFHPKYPQQIGGRERVQAAAQDIVRRYWGANGHVSVLSAHGRDGLSKGLLASNRMASLAGSDARDVAIPKFSWPMYGTLIEMLAAKKALYPNPGPDGKFEPDHLGDVDNLGTIIINPEENPSAALYTKEYMDGLMGYVEQVNKVRIEQGKTPIFVQIDSPYFHTRDADLDADVDAGEHYYGSSPIKDAIEKTKYTPVAACIPGTKAWATAAFGFSMIVANDRAQKLLAPVVLATNGLSGTEQQLHLVADFLDEKHDKARLKFEADLREKYAQNRAALMDSMKNTKLEIVPGGAGLTGLLEFDLSDYFGKTLEGRVTGAYKISDMTDMVEYLHLNHGVTTVNNGTDNGKGYLRIANAEFTEDYAAAVQRLAEGMGAIAAADPAPTIEVDEAFETVATAPPPTGPVQKLLDFDNPPGLG